MPIHDWTRVAAGMFHDFHHAWMVEPRNALNRGVLPPGYYAPTGRVAGSIEPDVLTLQSAKTPPRATDAPTPTERVVAVAEAPPKVAFTAEAEASHYARKRLRLVIRHRTGSRVIAMIEIVSPGNRSGRPAVGQRVRKSAGIILEGCHLLVVDLFPPGKRTRRRADRAVWADLGGEPFEPPPDKPLALVAFSAGPVQRIYDQSAAVGDVLPDMPLFLDPDYYVLVPLEATYEAAWGGFAEPWKESLKAGGANGLAPP